MWARKRSCKRQSSTPNSAAKLATTSHVLRIDQHDAAVRRLARALQQPPIGRDVGRVRDRAIPEHVHVAERHVVHADHQEQPVVRHGEHVALPALFEIHDGVAADAAVEHLEATLWIARGQQHVEEQDEAAAPGLGDDVAAA
jgi:hypothetical protein